MTDELTDELDPLDADVELDAIEAMMRRYLTFAQFSKAAKQGLRLVAALRSERELTKKLAWENGESADELERERTQNRAARALHQPVDEEAEVWADGPGEDAHAALFPECHAGGDCEGHVINVQVCPECGHSHDGDQPVFRRWPCPTLVALDAARAALSTQREPAPEPQTDTRERCEAVLAYDDSIGGEGVIRCNWPLDENGICANPDRGGHRLIDAALSTQEESK